LPAEQPKPSLYERFVNLIVPPAPPDSPLLLHADDPTTVAAVKPDTAVLCARCHTASAAKPKSFPQVDPADHSGGAPCQTCHNPHNPAFDQGPAATPVAGGAK
jgi:hypothetical protein